MYINKYETDSYLDFNINSRWKMQSVKIKLAFAMGLNDISSLLYNLDNDIIRCILENIDKLPIRDHRLESLYVTPMPTLELRLKPPRGGGKKRHNSKRKKSKRKKSKRKNSKRHKSKRRK